MPTKTARLALLPALLLLGLLAAPAAHAGGNSAMSWGNDFFGQLGYPGPELCTGFVIPCSKHPKAMEGVSTATEISATQNTTIAALGDGSVHVWGVNQYGQYGNGTTTGSAAGGTPTGLGAGVVQVSAGNEHGLALLSDGSVRSWGSNASGQLGLGESSGPETCEASTPCSKTPVAVPGLSEAIAVSAGSGYSVALLANGTVVAWGKDDRGQLGDGTGKSSGCKCVDHPVPVPGVSGAMAISAGNSAAAALLSDGTVRSWGYNLTGGLGNGTSDPGGTCNCLGPVQASGLSGVRQISSGGFFELALLGDGSVRSWGADSQGQLGNGSFNSVGCGCTPAPAPVVGISGVQAVSAGASHALALLGDGSVSDWGDNEDGALGDGVSETDRNSPGTVAGVSSATSVRAGGVTSFALTGASQALNVSLAGAGAGTVGGPAGILCGPSCSARFPQSQSEVLREEPAAGSAFAGWSGACDGTAVTCQLRMDGDQAVAATYGPPKGTAVTKLALDRKKRTATLTFSAPGAITGYECQLVPPKKKKKKHHGGRHGTARAAAAPKYTGCASPKTYKHLRPGAYTFRVRALDILGTDEHPAVRHFVVKAPKPKRHHHKK